MHMALTGENCLPVLWLIPAWFFHDMKWECSGQLACLAACAPSQGEFVLGASWGQITAACLPAQAIVQWEQGLSSYRASPTPQTYLLLPVPVLLQEG